MTGSQGAPAPRRRVAVVAPNWLGDAVMALPAIARIGTGASVAVIAPRYTARVFWRATGVDEVWIDPAPGGRLHRIRARARALRTYRADAAIVLPPSLSSALPAWLAGVPVRAGYAGEGRRLFLTDAMETPPRTSHLSAAYLALAARAGGSAGATPVVPRLHVSDADRRSIADRLRRAGVGPDFVVVVPGATFGPAKAWPWERYRALCEGLARDIPVVVSGGSGDRGVCGRVAEGIGHVASLAGETSLGEFFALAERAKVLVANDSGAPHVSAALGTPTVVLFGSTSPAWTAPLGRAVAVMQHVVHCNPCFRRTCPTQLECFNGIAPDEVASRVRSFLGEAARKPFAPSR